MRFFLALSLTTAFVLGAPLLPMQSGVASGSAIAGEMSLISKAAKKEKAERLNELFDELQRQAKPGQAKRTSRLIWQRWTESGSDTIDLMSLISKAAKKEKAERLNELFDELQRQAKPGQAKRTSRLIWQRWTESGSDTIDLLMDRVSTAMQDKNNQVALDLLAQVIALAPDYAEVWNRRATLYYTMNDFGRSISDIEQTLKLEPRHFGALAGLAVILQRLGRDEKALETWYRVLEIYPADERAQDAVIKLEDKLSGRPT